MTFRFANAQAQVASIFGAIVFAAMMISAAVPVLPVA